MIIKYEIWSRFQKRHGPIKTKEELKLAHEERKSYCLTYLEDDDKTPYCFLEIRDKYFFIGFLDEHKKMYLSYSFSEQGNGKLFLREATYYEYQENEIYKLIDYTFSIEGNFKIIETDYNTNEKIISEAKNKIDVSSHWEDYPEFGCYERLIIKERGMDL